MKPRTAIRIRRERRDRRWDEPRDDGAPKCPTCKRAKRTAYVGVHIRRGHRFLVPVRTEWRGMDYGRRGHRGRNVPLSRPIRLNWPTKVRRSSIRRSMGRTWAQCPDPFHDVVMDEEKPEPRQSNGIRRLMRANAPHKAKAKARRHRAAQSYQRR